MQNYQGGPYFEIFTTQGKDFAPNWKIHGGVKKGYEKEVKSYVYNLEGTPATTKMQFPKDSSQPLILIQRYLIFQLNVAKGQDFSIELGVTDLDNNKRRLHFSTAQKETQTTPLHAKIPLAILRRSVWLNMCIDLVSMVGEAWKSQTFKSVYSVCVSANCKLRRVFTMKTQPLDTSGDDEMYGCASSNTGEVDQIPRQCQLPTDVTQVTQLLTLTKIKHAERLKGGETQRGVTTLDLDLNASGRKSSLNDSFHIAFGTKIQGGRTVQQTSRRSTQGNMTNRSMRSNFSRMDSRTDDVTERDVSASIASRNGLLMRQDSEGTVDDAESVMYSSRLDQPENRSADQSQRQLHQRQSSDPLSKEDLEMYSRLDNSKHEFVQPHPPREPSSDRLRRKIRVKNGNGSANKERVSSAGSLKDESVVPLGTGKPVTGHSPGGPSPDKDAHRKRLVSDGDLLAVDKTNNSVYSTGRNRSAELPRKNHTDDIPETGIGRDVIDLHLSQQSKEYNREEYQGEGAEMDDSMSHVIELLRNQTDLSDVDSDDFISDGGGEEYEESDEEERSERGGVFIFVSKPKSAPRRHLSPNNLDSAVDLESSNQSRNSSKGSKVSLKKVSKELTARGPRPEDDFFNNNSSTDDDDTHIRKKLPGSRPNSGSRPTSGTNSRPTSGTNRPHSGTNITVSPKTGSAGHRRSHRKEKESSPNANTTKLTVEPVPMVAIESPDLKENSRLAASLQVPGLNGSLGSNSVSRMQRKSLREIPKTDARLMKSSEKPYDFTKYQMGEITESFEAKMFASMKRQNEEELEDVVESPRKLGVPTVQANKSPRHPNQVDPNTRHMYDFSPTLTISDDDTSLSTWQAPPNVPHNYQDEMKPPRLSTDTLTSSNPREWDSGGMFSPPIPCVANQMKNSTEDLSTSSNGMSPRKEPYDVSPRKAGLQTSGRQDTTDDDSTDELDLLYDPCLNCYYDPRSCKYYELI